MSPTKPPSKTASAKDLGRALDEAEGWESGTGVAPIPPTLAEKIGSSTEISISSIVEDHALQKYGLEFDPETNLKHKALQNSIRKFGVKVPICVKEIEPGRYRIIYGHKRVICCRNLGVKRIPALIADPAADENFLHLLENLFRTEPTTFDNASAARALLDPNIIKGVRYNRDDIASLFGWTKDWLDLLLDNLNAPSPLLDFFKAGADQKLLRSVRSQVQRSGKSPQEQLQVCEALKSMGINSLEPFVIYTRDQHMPITEAAEKIRSEGLAGDAMASSSSQAPLKKASGRPKGSHGASRKAVAHVMTQRLWDPIWLQKNGEGAKDLLVRITGISNAKADSLVLDHSAGTGYSLGMATLAALAISNPQPSSKPLDEKSALEYAKKLYTGPVKSSRKIIEQYLSAIAMLPDMMEELRDKDKPLYDYARRIFSSHKPAPSRKKSK